MCVTEGPGSIDPISCFGYCNDCGKVHTLPADGAVVHCYALMDQLRKHRRMDFEVPLAEANPLLSTDILYSEMRGRMFGILVCEDHMGNEVVLRAFSSRHNGVWNIANWVPPLVDEHAFVATVADGNVGIHPLTDLIQTLPVGSPEWKERVAERKVVSHGILARLYALYEVWNFREEKRSLEDAFNVKKGIPVGTGDCCAPKLLNHAARHQLKPLSLAEFFWGRETASGQRIEGGFYPSCTDKCQPLLGYMLCGAEDYGLS